MRAIGDRGFAGGRPEGLPSCRGERRGRNRVALLHVVPGAAALGGLLLAAPVPAAELFAEGDLRGSLDTTLSHGMTVRVASRQARASDYLSTNSNDGNLNYDKGLVSNTSKLTTDLDIDYRHFGVFVRATGFVDLENKDGHRDRTTLHDEARDRVGKDFEILDAYVTGSFAPGETPVDVRLGRHVLNWGESTFVPNGINAFNRIDVSKLRLPGSELREALAPTSMVSVSAAPTYNLSFEGFYQLEWEETAIDPVGSYFSVTDYVGPGATKAVITDPALKPFFESFGFASNLDQGFSFGPLTPAINADLQGYTVPVSGFAIPLPQPPVLEFDPEFMSVLRGPDRKPADSGQWGVALRYLAEGLNQTEFGLHFGNYHSRLPVVGARTSSPEALTAGLLAAGAVAAGLSEKEIEAGVPFSHTATALSAAAAPAVTGAVTAQVMAAVRAGQVEPANAQREIDKRVKQELAKLVEPAMQGIAATLAIDRFARTPDSQGSTGHYYAEYPEDIRFLGLSFNTVLGRSGWALQGEYTFHLDAPLQRAERTVFEEGLAPVINGLQFAKDNADNFAAIQGYLASYQPVDVEGGIRHNVSQVQATATKVFGPTLGADALVFLTEAAMMQVHDMADEPLESPARTRRLSDDPNDTDADADAISWGYRAAARLDYSNAVGAVNLYPYVQWGHDVAGNSPAPSGPFVEGRTSLTLGMYADYLSRWEADISFTTFGGMRNELYDRDFVSASIKYSF